MQAMVCEGAGRPLALRTLPRPEPGPGEVQIAVRACGVCRTDLHLVDGELPDPKVPVIPGHEIVGTITAHGPGVTAPAIGTRVGVPWLGGSCGHCGFCTTGRENLCADARFTGYQRDGGYAEYAVADARYVFPLPDRYDDVHAAPLLCAGLIGYRAYALAGEARTLGLYGFGAAAHLIAQVALAQGRTVFAFTRPGDRAAQAFAQKVGVHWAGDSDATAPAPLDAALIFAPAGALIPAALAGDGTRRHRRLRRHPHERHTGVSLPAALGRALRALGRQPHPTRRRGVSRTRGDDTPVGARRALSAGARQRRARAAARRCRGGCRRIDAGRLKASNEQGVSISIAIRHAGRTVAAARMAIRPSSRPQPTTGAMSMATKSAPKSAPKPAAAKPARKKAKRAAKAAPKAAPKSAAKIPDMFTLPDATQLAEYAKTLTPEQAFELYRANAKLALDVIDAAIESTAKMRRLQFEGEESARTMQKKVARRAAEAGDVPALMAAGQSASQEAIERSMAYWGQMFDLVVEMQKRLFALMENQMSGVPGVKQAKAAMAMMPDMTQMQNVVSAMQGVMSSGGSAFESMQKVMGDFARMSGIKR